MKFTRPSFLLCSMLLIHAFQITSQKEISITEDDNAATKHYLKQRPSVLARIQEAQEQRNQRRALLRGKSRDMEAIAEGNDAEVVEDLLQARRCRRSLRSCFMELLRMEEECFEYLEKKKETSHVMLGSNLTASALMKMSDSNAASDDLFRVQATECQRGLDICLEETKNFKCSNSTIGPLEAGHAKVPMNNHRRR